MKYIVKITNTAKKDLKEISAWILKESKDIITTKKFTQELISECEKLDTFPNAGSYPKDKILVSLEFHYITYKNYLIFYKVDENSKTVNIMAVLNSKRDYVRYLLNV